MGKSGGGGSGQTSNTFSPPMWTQQQWPDLVEAGTQLYSQPMQEYQGQRIAGINNTQSQGMQYLADLSGNTSPDLAAARNQLQQTAMGGFENPYATMQSQVGQMPNYGREVQLPKANDPNTWNGYLGQKINGGDYGGVMGKFDAKVNGGDYGGIMGQFGDKVNGGDYGGIMGQFGGQVNGGNYDFAGQNQWANKTTDSGQNAFKGFGPAYQAMKDRSMADMAKAYSTGTAAQTDATFNRPGAFGSSGHDNAIKSNEYNFGQALAGLSEKMDMSQWQNSGQLDSEDLGRSTQAQLGDYGRNAQYTNAGQGLGVQAQLGDMGRNYQYTNAGLDRSVQAQLGDMGRNNQLYNAGLDRSTQAQIADMNRNAQYTNAGLDRGVSAQAGDLGRNSQLSEAALNRRYDLENQNINRNVQNEQFMNSLGLQAQTADSNRASQYWDSERNRQFNTINPALAAGQYEQGNAKNLLSIGDMQRGYTQDNLNLMYGDWQQRMNYPQQMLTNYAGLLSQASGNYGTQTAVQNQPMYQANPFASAVGYGMAGAGAYNAMMKP